MKGQTGKLIYKAGRGNYTNPDAPEKLIRYITRTNGKAGNDLAAWGGLGVTEFAGVDAVIRQFSIVQETYERNGEFGRHIDHEIFSLSPEAEHAALSNHVDLDRMAREMARDIYENDHCQVVYGVHRPDRNDAHTHIHFGINTVSYRTGRKRRENKRQTREREERFGKVVEQEIERSSSGQSAFLDPGHL